MGFIKGLTNFILMFCLSVLLSITMLYGILNHSVLSYDTNKEMLETTSLTEEVTEQILVRYSMKLESISLDDDLLLNFVNASGKGVVAYVFSETDELPEVDVSFLKTYVEEEVASQISSSFTENVNIDEIIDIVKAVPEGDSLSKTINTYLEDANLDISDSDVEKATKIFIENKDLDKDTIKAVLIKELSQEIVNTTGMKETLSLQQFFDKLMVKNPFTIVREGFDVVDKNFSFYLPFIIVLILLLMTIIEFKLSNSIIWFVLALIVAILPLQLLRLANFFLDKDYISILKSLESYQTFMMDSVISRLNLYTIIVLVVVILLIILKKVLKAHVDDKIAPIIEKKKMMWFLIRFAGFSAILLVSFLVAKSANDFNMNYYDDLKQIQPSDFDPIDLDDVLSDGLEIDFDF